MVSEQNFFTQNKTRLVFLGLTVLIMVIYWQTVGFGFINLDDNQYVYDNLAVRDGLTGETVKWAFTAFHSANWHPLTWLSHMLDVKLFGLNAGGHHATNTLLHLINAVLAFAVFRRLTDDFWKSAILAALFAVHPAHVESVAWISERKDVLSTAFWLLTMLAYVQWTEKGANIKSPFYALTILLFACGLMSKPMLVTLPFVLLLCDLWPLGRWKLFDWKCLGLLVAEKIPFFILSGVSAYITILAQRSGGAFESLEYLPLGTRFLNAFVSYTKYVGTLFYPANLAVWYPYEQNLPMWQIVASIVFLTVVTALCIWQMRERKYLLMGWLWFLGTLVPVIGIVQVGSQAMADRYTYVPFFGLFVMLVWGLGELFEKFALPKQVPIILGGAAILIFTFLSFQQTKLWRSNETLFKHTLTVTRDNHLISHNLCYALMIENRFDEAEPLCKDALRVKPDYILAYNTLGILEMKRKRLAEAEQNFLKALELSPNYALGHANIAVAQALLGKPEEAEASLEKAVRLSGDTVRPEAWINTLRDVSFAYLDKQNYPKAAENLQRILVIDPRNPSARSNLALTFKQLKRYDEAQQLIESSIQLNPNEPTAYNIYGLILLDLNRPKEAVPLFEKALQLRPDFAEAKENLKKAKGEK